MHARIALLATAALLASTTVVGSAATAATAATEPVRLVLDTDGQGLHVRTVGVRPDGTNADSVIDVVVSAGELSVSSSQPDPGGNGALVAVDELGWIPTAGPLRVQAAATGAPAIDVTLPAQLLGPGPSPNTLVGRTVPNADVSVGIDDGTTAVGRSTMSDSNGVFTLDATTGPGDTLPARWRFATTLEANVRGTVDGQDVNVTMTYEIGTAAVTLRDGDDEVTVTHDRGATVTMFGRTSRTGAIRTDVGPVGTDTPVIVDGVSVPLAGEAPIDVTDVDLETLVASGTATPGGRVTLDATVYADNFTGSVGTFGDVAADGSWSVDLGVPASAGPFTGAMIVAQDAAPAVDGATYSVTRTFGEIPADARSSDSDSGSARQTQTQPRGSRAAADNVVRRVHVDAEHSIGVSQAEGDGTTHVLTATTDDGTVHEATVEAIVVFGVSARATGSDFAPPLDLRRAFDLEIDRGGTVSTARFEPFDLAYDPAITGFRGTIGPGQEVSLETSVLGWSANDAERATATADADGNVVVGLGIPTPMTTAVVRVGAISNGTQGGFTEVQPVVVPVGEKGGRVLLGTELVADVAAGGPTSTLVELQPRSSGPPATPTALFVRADGDRRRVPAATTDLAVSLGKGQAVVDDAPADVLVTDTSSGRSTSTRIPTEPLRCLDPGDLPDGCDAPLPTPYMVLRDVPITGSFELAPRRTDPLTVVRAAGQARVGTSVAISNQTFPAASFLGISLVDTVIVANSANFPDALAAAPLANAVRGPVLLNPTDALDPQVAQELARIAPSRVFLMGGTAALSLAVEEAVEDLGVANVIRFAGEDRFETAALAGAEAVRTWRAAGDDHAGDGVLIALGTHPVDQNRAWPDALAAGPLAANSRQPILLTRQDGVPSSTAAALDELGATSVTVLGGPVAIPKATAQELGRGRTLQRIGGDDRYHTSTLLADAAWSYAGTRASVWVATGAAFPDGLAASAAAAISGHMLVLTPPSDITVAPTLTAWLDARRPDTSLLQIAGGPVAVSEAAETALVNRLD